MGVIAAQVGKHRAHRLVRGEHRGAGEGLTLTRRSPPVKAALYADPDALARA